MTTETKPAIKTTESGYLEGPLPENAARDLMNQFTSAIGFAEEASELIIDNRKPEMRALNNSSQAVETLVGHTLTYRKDGEGVRSLRMGTPREYVAVTVPPDSAGTVMLISLDDKSHSIKDRLHAEAEAKKILYKFIPKPQEQPSA